MSKKKIALLGTVALAGAAGLIWKKRKQEPKTD